MENVGDGLKETTVSWVRVGVEVSSMLSEAYGPQPKININNQAIPPIMSSKNKSPVIPIRLGGSGRRGVAMLGILGRELWD